MNMNRAIDPKSEVTFMAPETIINIQSRKITKLEADNFHLAEENQQLRFDAGYIDSINQSTSDYEPYNFGWGFKPLSKPHPLKLWFYRHTDQIFFTLALVVAVESLIMAGKTLGWW
jgi:hypothetical protein